MKFLICEHCGNVFEVVNDSGVAAVCCGEAMKELQAGVKDAAKEKHVPVIAADGNVIAVSVGSVTHPMESAHSIEWIAVETTQGVQRKALRAGEKPEARFALAEGDELVAAYAYCNLHGLWKA